MTFKTRPNSFRITLAPTNRARCGRCRSLIEKGSVRIDIHAFVRPQRATVFFRCTACIDQALAAAVIERHRRAERVPADKCVPEESVASVRKSLDELAVPRSAVPQHMQLPIARSAEQQALLPKLFSAARETQPRPSQ